MNALPKKLLVLTFFGIAVTALFSTRPAQAGYIVTLKQVGSDVVATGSGAVDLTGLTLRVSGTLEPGVITANIGIIQIGGSLDNPFIDQYTGITGPTNFGSGNTFEASTNSGDFVGIFGLTGNIDVPHGYVSDSLPYLQKSRYFIERKCDISARGKTLFYYDSFNPRSFVRLGHSITAFDSRRRTE